MAENRQYSFRLSLDDPTERELSALLSGKPTTYIIVEALKLYKRFEEARERAVENAIAAIAAPARTAAAPVTSSNDDIEDFDL